MTDHVKDGGPAFPATRFEEVVSHLDGRTRSYEVSYPGMSLRDYFAAQAIGAATSITEPFGVHSIARVAYEIADAMLAERERK